MTDTPQTIDPRHTALLVMDYQHATVGMVDDADTLLSRAAEAIAVVRQAGGQVGHVRVAFTDDELDAIPAHSPFARLLSSRDAFRADAPATAIHERVAPEDGDVVVRKTRVGAFSTTDLDEQLRGRDVDTLVLAGISTSGVVLSTFREAIDRDYRVAVVTDACFDPEPGVHEFLTERIFARHGQMVTVSELGDLLRPATT